MKKTILLLLIIAPFFALAQEVTDTYKYKTREVGLNATPFLTNFVSIGDVALKNQVATFTYKNVNYKNNALRVGFGIHIDNEFFRPSDNTFHLRVGFERRRPIKDNWWFYWGVDALLHVDDTFAADPNPSFATGFGLGPVLGIFYEINSKLTLSTESSLYLIFSDGANISFVPPVSLFFNIRFTKMKRRYKYMEKYINKNN